MSETDSKNKVKLKRQILIEIPWSAITINASINKDRGDKMDFSLSRDIVGQCD